VVDEDLAFELGGCRGCLKAKSQGRRDRGEAAGARDERIDHGRATHRTSILMSRIGCPSSSRKRTQKSLSPGPLITAPRRTLRPSWRVRRSDSTSSITILRSSNSSATTSPFNHHRDAELEPTASRTSRISRGLSITVTAQNTTPYFGLPRAWAKLNSFTSHSFESRACQRSGCAACTVSFGSGRESKSPGKVSRLSSRRTYVPVNTVLVRLGLTIGSSSSQRRRKPSSSGAIAPAVAGWKNRDRGGVDGRSCPAAGTEPSPRHATAKSERTADLRWSAIGGVIVLVEQRCS